MNFSRLCALATDRDAERFTRDRTVALTGYRLIAVGNGRRTPIGSERVRPVRPGALAVRPVPRPVRWSFVLFVFAFPFETLSLGFMRGALSLPKLCGFLFFATYLLHYGPLARKSFPAFGQAMFWFSAYAAIFLLHGWLVDEPWLSSFLVRGFTIVQLLILFWTGADLLRDAAVNRGALRSYLAASLFLAVGVIFHLPGFEAELDAGRVTGLGDNPNEVAQHMAVALIILIGLYVDKRRKRLRTSTYLIGAALPLAMLLVLTGSRGGVLAFVGGCLLYLMPRWRSQRTATTIMAAAIGIIAVLYMSASNEYVSARWQQAYYEGSLSGREEILPAAVGMIAEEPLFGWHPVNWFYELGRRTGHPEGKDAHNLVLALLLEVGILGAIPFFVGYGLCFRAAWKARGGPLGMMPAALLSTVLAAGMSGTTLTWKTQWWVLSLALAMASLARRQSFSCRAAGLMPRARFLHRVSRAC